MLSLAMLKKILFAIILFMVAGYAISRLVVFKKPSSSPVPSPSPSPTLLQTTPSSTREVFQAVLSAESKKNISYQTLQKPSQLAWIDPNGWEAVTKGASSLTFLIPDFRLSDPNAKEQDILTLPQTSLFTTGVKEAFQQLGYQANEQNTFLHGSNTQCISNFSYAFQKDASRCTYDVDVRIFDDRDPQFDPDVQYIAYNITCSDDYQTVYDQTKPFLDALKIKNQPIIIDGLKGDFAAIGIGENCDSALQFMRKINGVWQKAGGEHADLIYCSEADKYHLPSELYFHQCYAANGQTTIHRP